MFKNYLKISWRNLIKNKAYSAINIGGLALGITACLLILQYVGFETSYEDFHEDKDQIYRVKQERYNDGVLTTEWAAGAFAVGNKFSEAIPEIEDYVKVAQSGDVIVDKGNETLKIDKVFYSSESFFDIFSYPLLSGDKSTIFNEPRTAALSETTARKVFGSTDVVGKTIEFNGNIEYRVTGIYRDMPSNTQLQPNILLSYITFRERVLADNDQDPEADSETWWFSDGCLTYLKLKEGIDPSAVEAKFVPVVEELAGEGLRQYNSDAKYLLQPLTDIHLYSNYMMEPSPTGDGKTVYLLLGIAFFIIIIAWVNYINLATARAIGRAREVGVRKAVGSHRKQLIIQFFFESALFNSLALVLGLALMALMIPAFNQISGQELSYELFTQGSFWAGLIVIFVVGVFLSGAYPAFVLSSFKPVDVLKGKIINTKQGALLRKSLVVFQFAASLFLLIGTLTVYQQIQYMRKQSLGLNIDKTLVVVPPIVTDSTYLGQMTSFKESLLKYPSIKSVAAASTIPGQPVGWNAGGIKLVSEDDTAGKQYRVIGVDYDYVDQFGLKMIAGRAFSEEFGADPEAVIFNRAGITQLGFNKPEEAIGKRIDFWGNQYTVIGVSENFNQESLRLPYEPLVIRLIPDIRGYFTIKQSTTDVAQTIAQVKTEWNKFFPGNTYEYFFLDEHFNDQYQADQRFGKVFGLFTGLAILVACLGLFGLASFTTLQRTKEIGIRKVLGSSVSGILKLLYKEFALLLFIAFLIAIPIAWFTTSNWLQGYAFRIDIHWSFFFLPFLAIMLIALVTVSFQTIKASLANPVDSLRTE
ncbi:ABC transporter permease [Maribacter sp. 4U21]|uniref:ABC transporter permease n=1 Tax=Maribacter sp. 4U21 TaxID=1889779 RepID=UPI000C147C4F|nr:ABC transporter permease [Maribacter sp. 4U21]PIB30793.1 ABC transporter permease [Maribacter sp. 4U21]